VQNFAAIGQCSSKISWQENDKRSKIQVRSENYRFKADKASECRTFKGAKSHRRHPTQKLKQLVICYTNLKNRYLIKIRKKQNRSISRYEGSYRLPHIYSNLMSASLPLPHLVDSCSNEDRSGCRNVNKLITESLLQFSEVVVTQKVVDQIKTDE